MSPGCHLNLSPSAALFFVCLQSFPASVKVKGAQLSLTLGNPIDCLWNYPGQNTGVGSHSLLQGIFPAQGSNPDLLHAGGFFIIWATKEALLTSWSFRMSQLFTTGGHGIGASASVLPMNVQDWFTSGLTGLISLLSKGLSRVFPSTTVWKHQLWCSAFFMVQSSHPYVTARKTIAFTIWTFVSKLISLLLNTMCRFVIAFLPRSKRLLISWLQWPSAVILEPRKIQSVTLFSFHPSIYAIFVCLSLQCVVSTDP